MNTDDSPSRRPTIAQLLTALAAALVLIFGFGAGTAQTDDDGERRFENGIPAHVPLKVRLKNERAFKDKKNKEWAKELELEVKNTGTKPIYFLNLSFILDDFRLEGGHPIAFGISYGRAELLYLDTPLIPEDVPIGPGETITLKIPEEQTRGYAVIRDRRQKADAKKVKFNMQFINFGDGTGLEMPVGVPSHNRRGSQNSTRPPQGDQACKPPPRASEVPAKLVSMFDLKPASFLRVNFLAPEATVPQPAAARACNCQNTPDCFYGRLRLAHHCPCDNNSAFLAHVSTGNCSDLAARCRQVQMVHQPCPTQVNSGQVCSFD